MGNYRFRLSDMMPNAWFYKLRDMSKTRNHNPSHPTKKNLPEPAAASHRPHLSQPPYSYQFITEPTGADRFYDSQTNPKASDTHFPDPPRRSSKRRANRKTIYRPSPALVSSSVFSGRSCHMKTLKLVRTNSDTIQSEDYFVSASDSSPDLDQPHETLPPEFRPAVASELSDGLASWSSSCSCGVSSSTADFIIDMNNKDSTSRNVEKLDGFDTICELELPPILTKPSKINDMTTKAAKCKRSTSKLEEIKAHDTHPLKIAKEESTKARREPKASFPGRKSSTYSAGLKLRANSPRIGSRKIQGYGRRSVSSSTSSKIRRRSLSESFAIVKSSLDPQRDFRDSMLEMIVENNIRASKDLEELLVCYLSLNSDEYHDLIIRVFEQIWIDMTDFHK